LQNPQYDFFPIFDCIETTFPFVVSGVSLEGVLYESHSFTLAVDNLTKNDNKTYSFAASLGWTDDTESVKGYSLSERR
jgi:hypothetical protein